MSIPFSLLLVLFRCDVPLSYWLDTGEPRDFMCLPQSKGGGLIRDPGQMCLAPFHIEMNVKQTSVTLRHITVWGYTDCAYPDMSTQIQKKTYFLQFYVLGFWMFAAKTSAVTPIWWRWTEFGFCCSKHKKETSIWKTQQLLIHKPCCQQFSLWLFLEQKISPMKSQLDL